MKKKIMTRQWKMMKLKISLKKEVIRMVITVSVWMLLLNKQHMRTYLCKMSRTKKMKSFWLQNPRLQHQRTAQIK